MWFDWNLYIIILAFQSYVKLYSKTVYNCTEETVDNIESYFQESCKTLD